MSTSVPATCPALDELERAIQQNDVPPEMADHLQRCAACRAAEQQIRDNLSFMKGMLAELSDGGSSGVLSRSITPPDPDLLPGYSLTREIARGGQGTVFEGIQTATRRRVAVKVIDATKRGLRGRRRIEREAEIVAGLRHPNIVTVYHSTPMDDGRYALAMEYIDGTTLDAWAKRTDAKADSSRESCRDAVRTKLRAMIAICDAVQYAHQNGVIHRDLKPANVLVEADGTPRVVDFGIARRIAGAQAITRTGAFAGTLAYASPEQVSGSADAVDTRSDVYSLGLILYEILTTRRPYETEGSLTGAIASITSVEPAPLGAIQPGGQPAGAELEAIVRRALAKDRDRRYQTAGALKADLENFLEGKVVEARRESNIYMLRKAAVKYRVPVAIGAAFAILLTTLTVSTLLSSRTLARQGRLLSENLATSNIERGRLLSLTGQHAPAEALIWPELIHAGGFGDDSGLGYTSNPRVTQAAWALREVYSRQPIDLHFKVDSAPGVVGFSPDGRLIRVLFRDGHYELHDRASGRLVKSSPGAAIGGYNRVDLSTDQRRAAMLASDAMISMDLDTLEQVRFEDPELRRVFRADISSDGERLLVLEDGGSLSLWSTHPIRRIKTLARNLNAFSQAKFSYDGTLAVSCVEDIVQSWRSNDGELVGQWRIPPSVWAGLMRPGVSCVRISPDNREIALAIINNVLFFDAKDPSKPPIQIAAQRGFVNSLRYSDDGAIVVTTGQEESIRVWDAATKTLRTTIETGARMVEAPALTPDGSAVAMCDFAGGVRVYDLNPTSWHHTLTGFGATVNRVAFTPDTSLLAAAAGDGEIKVWRTAERKLLWHTPTSSVSRNALAFSPDGKTLAVASEDGAIEFRDPADGSLVGPSFVAPQRPTWIGFTPDGKALAVACTERALRFYDPTTGTSLFELSGHERRIAEAAFSADGAICTTVSIDGVCIVWDVATRSERFRLKHPAAARAVAISADRSLIATGADDRCIRLWDARTGALVREFNEAKHHVFGLAFHPAGNVIFSCCRDPVIQVWDVRTGREIAALTGHEDVIPALALSADGGTLAAASGDRTVGLWDLRHYDDRIRANGPAWLPKDR